MDVKRLTLRVPAEMLEKLHSIAKNENRSANGQITVLIRDCVAEFEKRHGEIVVDKV